MRFPSCLVLHLLLNHGLQREAAIFFPVEGDAFKGSGDESVGKNAVPEAQAAEQLQMRLRQNRFGTAARSGASALMQGGRAPLAWA